MIIIITKIIAVLPLGCYGANFGPKGFGYGGGAGALTRTQ